MHAVSLSAWAKALSILLAGIASWLLVTWVDVYSPGISDLQVRSMELAALSTPNPAALAQATFVPAQSARDTFRHAGRFGVARLKFLVRDPQSEGLALFVRRVRDNYAVYVNGRLALPAPGLLAERSTLHGFHPRFVRLLPTFLVTGQNTVDILSARNATQSALREVYFGPASRLEPAFRHAQTIVHDNAETAALAAGIVLLFALAMSPLVRPALTLTIAVTLALLVARLLHTLWVNEPWPQAPRDVYLNVVAPLIWVACAAFINEWTDGSATYRRWFVAAGALCSLVVIGLFLAIDCAQANVVSSYAEAIAGIAALSFMAQRLVRHYFAAPPAAAAEIFVACIGLAMAGASVVTQNDLLPFLSRSAIQGEAFAQLGTLAIICFVAMGLARHGTAVYQLAALNNETLRRRVAEKESELEANHALLREQERERTLAGERSRIMRDVHDGIGSQLLGLLVQARSGAAKSNDMMTGLQAAIDDLYLVVDSLDGVDGSLETALGTFRSRIEPKCTAAGVEVGWEMEDIKHTKPFGPATILQIYRILQEALSNAIRHGRPKRVVFSLRWQSPGGPLSLLLNDDGAGFETRSSPTGRGIANMRKRAASIGAHLDITSGATGTCVHLSLPH